LFFFFRLCVVRSYEAIQLSLWRQWIASLRSQ
jgi:hypothetical protein